MDHIYQRIINFIDYRPGVFHTSFGEFIVDAEKNPEKYRQNFWAVNCALDQFPHDTLAHVVKQHGLHSNCAFLTADPDIVQAHRHLNFRYFPYFMAEGIAQIKVNNELENPPIAFDARPNRLSCVNRFARFHRVYTFYKLSQQPRLTDMKIAFTRLETKYPDANGVLNPVEFSFDDFVEVAQEHGYDSEDFRSWLQAELPNWPRQIEQYDNIDNKYDNWVKSVAFSGSYANIVTDTYVRDFVPTEKVVKPLLAGCLIMAASSQNYMKKLERMGFDLQFEGIDYSRYDALPTWIERVDQVAVLANDIYPEIEHLWHANLDRLKHNRNLFFSSALEQHVIDDVRDIFELR